MKVILDECLPKRLISELPGYEVVTVPMVGWAGVKNTKDRIPGRFISIILAIGFKLLLERLYLNYRSGSACSGCLVST